MPFFYNLLQQLTSQMLVGDHVFKEFKGAFSEQFILLQLVVQGFSPYYWSSDKTLAEIDFVVQTEHRMIPIKVRSKENVRAHSMSEYIKKVFHIECNDPRKIGKIR